jgi:sugar lactone lactonase YvrE
MAKQATSPAQSNPDSAGNPPMRKRLIYFGVFALIIAGITLGAGSLLYNDVVGRLGGERHEAKAVAADVLVAPFYAFNEADSYPVGIAAGPDGELYVSLFGKGKIQRLNADGSLGESLPGLSAPGAIARASDGTFYVIDYSGVDFRALGRLKRLTSAGASEFGAAINSPGLPLLADLALDGAGNIYVSDPERGQIWRVTPEGSDFAWWAMPVYGSEQAQPTGLAYSPSENALYVADAGTGILYRLPLAESAPRGEILYRQMRLNLRSIAIDEQGRVFLGLWQGDNGQIAYLTPAKQLLVLADDLRAPLGMVARQKQIIVANSDLPGLFDQIEVQPPFTLDKIDLAAFTGF